MKAPYIPNAKGPRRASLVACTIIAAGVMAARADLSDGLVANFSFETIEDVDFARDGQNLRGAGVIGESFVDGIDEIPMIGKTWSGGGKQDNPKALDEHELTPPEHTEGKIDQGIRFSAGSYLETDWNNQEIVELFNFGANAGEDPTGFTIAAWVKVEQFTKNWQCVVGKGEQNQWRMHRRENGTTMTGNGGNDDTPNGTAQFEAGDGLWRHCILVSDVPGNRHAFYVDGEEDATADNINPQGNIMPMMIGQNPDTGDRTWEGWIDEVVFWNRALTPEEIAELYNEGEGLSLGRLGASDDDPNAFLGSKSKLGQVPSTPATEHEVRLRNTGPTRTLTISKVEVTGADMDHFTVVDFPETMDPDSVAFIKLSFDPKRQTGAFVATLEITSNDQTEAVNTIQLEASVINRLGPASHLPLDETEGTDFADISGNGNPGILKADAGSVTLGEPGLAGGTAVKVAGGGQVVIGGGSFDVLENFSISLWIQLDSVGESPATVFAKGNVATPAFALLAIGNSLGWLPAEAGEQAEFTAEEVLTVGEANHVVVVYDDTAGARKATIYVDGEAKAVQEDPIGVTDDRGYAIQIGSYNGTLALDGVIDDVQVYPRALSAGEVVQMKENPGQPLPVGEQPPIDSDGDGLTDEREAELGTLPLELDTDEDGLNDGEEVNVYQTDPKVADTDGDGFGDLIEVQTESDPNDRDVTPIEGNVVAAYWDFDDASDTENVTATEGGHVGELLEAAAFTPDGEGRSGQAGDRAMDFGAANDSSAMVADGEFLNAFAVVDQMTVVFWQRLRTVTSMTTFKARSPSSSGTERGWSVHTPWGNRNIYFDTAGCCEGATQRINKGAPGVDFLEWNHFAFVKNGPDKQIWVNGELFHQGRNTSPLPTDFTEIWLGSALDGSESLDGMLDDFAIFKIALTEQAIGKLARGARPTDTLGTVDEDGDGWDDDIERSIFGDLTETPTSDKDGDGLGNLREIEETGTDPKVADTDGDTLGDGAELAADPPTDPLKEDTDNDSLNDGDELTRGTNPALRDTDGDNWSDGIEVADGTDPLDPESNRSQGEYGPIDPRLAIGVLASVDDLFIHGAFTHAVNIGGTTEDFQVGDIPFVTDTPGPDNIEFSAQNHAENWGNASDFGADADNMSLASVVHDIRWSGRPNGVQVTLKDVEPGAYRLQMLFGEKCCDRAFAVRINGELLQLLAADSPGQAEDVVLDVFSPNDLQGGDHGGSLGAYIIYEFNQETAGEIVIDLNGADVPNPDGNAILSGVSLEYIRALEAANPYESAVLADLPLSYWRFEEVEGQSGVADLGSSGTIGTYNGIGLGRESATPHLGTAAEWSGGAGSSNIDFGEFNAGALAQLANIDNPEDDAFDPNKKTSLEFWMKTSDTGNHADNWRTQVVFGEESPGDGDLQWGYLRPSGRLSFAVNDANHRHHETTDPINDDEFHHFVITYDWETGQSHIYVDGELDTEFSGGGNRFQDFDGGALRYMGWNSRPDAAQGDNAPDKLGQFVGLLDEVAIYDYILGPERVKGHYEAAFAEDEPNTGPAELPGIAVGSGADGSISVSLAGGGADASYDLQYSEDLRNWEVIAPDLAGESAFQETDAARLAKDAGFYRAVAK